MSITREDYASAYSQRELADRCDPDGRGQEQAGVFEWAVAQAETDVDALVAARPEGVPEPSAAFLKGIILAVTRYKLFLKGMSMSTLVQEEYDRALKLLTSVTNRKTAPAGSSGSSSPVEPLVNGPLLDVESPPRLFSRKSQAGL